MARNPWIQQWVKVHARHALCSKDVGSREKAGGVGHWCRSLARFQPFGVLGLRNHKWFQDVSRCFTQVYYLTYIIYGFTSLRHFIVSLWKLEHHGHLSFVEHHPRRMRKVGYQVGFGIDWWKLGQRNHKMFIGLYQFPKLSTGLATLLALHTKGWLAGRKLVTQRRTTGQPGFIAFQSMRPGATWRLTCCKLL